MRQKKYLGNEIQYNRYQIQPNNSVVCGHLCLYVLSHLSEGTQFNDIIYLSRSPIPSLTKKYFYTHHGPVCLKNNILKKYIKFKFSSIQKDEDNEWLNLIFNGYKIKSKFVKNISREINSRGK